MRGNSHVRYEIRGECLRLLTNMPLTYLCEERSFALTETTYFALTWGLGIEDDLAKVSHEFLDQTARDWRMWVKHCSIPVLHQEEVIRSALALKLHCYEDTGAILAALTTSLPEEPGGPRNWDYRSTVGCAMPIFRSRPSTILGTSRKWKVSSNFCSTSPTLTNIPANGWRPSTP